MNINMRCGLRVETQKPREVPLGYLLSARQALTPMGSLALQRGRWRCCKSSTSVTLKHEARGPRGGFPVKDLLALAIKLLLANEASIEQLPELLHAL